MSALPLLHGNVRSRALAALEAVSDALCGEIELGDDLSVCSGRAGLALGLDALASATGDPRVEASADRRLDEALDRVAAAPTPPWLYAGYSGVAWAADQIAWRRGEPRDGVDEVDEALEAGLNGPAWGEDWDLLYGLTGYGWYAAHRPDTEATRRIRAHVLRHLRCLARLDASGAQIWTPGALLDLRSGGPDPGELGHADQVILGLAHGSPAAMILLAASGDGDDLLTGLAESLIAHRGPDGRWPAWVTADGPVNGWRCAWCYGDPGVSLALHAAGRRLGRPDWLALAEGVALDAARAWMSGEAPREPGLCHGAAGAAHLFHRLYQRDGHAALADAAVLALKQTLDLWRPGEGCGGFAAWTRLPDGRVDWSPDPGLLSGSLGVALALADALGLDLPPWDRILMTSLELP